jgi:hypothetical protein
VNALGNDVARATGNLAADGEAVPVQKGAVGNCNVATGIIAPRRIDGPSFDGDVVVARVGIEMVDANVR